jgi:hypothetical protein
MVYSSQKQAAPREVIASNGLAQQIAETHDSSRKKKLAAGRLR